MDSGQSSTPVRRDCWPTFNARSHPGVAALGERQSLALYANVDLLESHSTWTVSPGWSVALAESVGAFVEGGYQFGSAQDQMDNAVAGGELTWMVTPVVQLDAHGLVGLTRNSTELAAGLGVSAFCK